MDGRNLIVFWSPFFREIQPQLSTHPRSRILMHSLMFGPKFELKTTEVIPFLRAALATVNKWTRSQELANFVLNSQCRQERRKLAEVNAYSIARSCAMQCLRISHSTFHFSVFFLNFWTQ
jgi:hypothetical protein